MFLITLSQKSLKKLLNKVEIKNVRIKYCRLGYEHLL